MASMRSSNREQNQTMAITSLRVIFGSLGQSARSIEGRTGLTNAQLFLLRQLAETDAMSVNELAARARTRQNTVSTVLARLAKGGLVSKTRSLEDARSVSVSLTPKARRLLLRAPTPPTTTLIDALETLSPRDVRALASGLGALVSAMGLEGEDAPLLFEQTRPSR
ncbi:hypothetical protein BH11GEM1_BH11GEM1_08350 [soil metagenome]